MKDDFMLNNNGFTLVEVVVCLVIISFILIIVVSFSSNTLSINKEKAYEIMKSNISKASVSYLNECNSLDLDCKLSWNNNKTSFYVEKLRDSGYFKSLISPIDGKDISRCLIIEAYKQNGTIDINILDNCY